MSTFAKSSQRISVMAESSGRPSLTQHVGPDPGRPPRRAPSCGVIFRAPKRPTMSTPTLGTPTLIGLPYDASSSFRRGTAAAPPTTREALHSPAGNPWTETGAELSRAAGVGDGGGLARGVG